MKAEEQLKIIEEGVEEILPREDLLRKLEQERPLRVKYGADPTAPDLHLGHALCMRKLKQLHDLGHEIVFVIGDFTGRLGDPSERTATRKMLNKDEVEINAKTYMDQVYKMLDRDRIKTIFNSTWFDDMTFQEVIGLASKYTVAKMLERDDFSNRYKNGLPISLTEFLYPLIQGYDSVALKADIELGGTDQKFNLIVARDIQKGYGQEPQVLLLMPLLVGLDGAEKMSKSKGNHIGITEDPDQMFGKVMSLADELLPTYFELATQLPKGEIEDIERALAKGQLHPMEAKKRLAREIVKMYHSEEIASAAEKEFERVFSRKELPTDIPECSVSGLKNGKIWIIKLLLEAGMATTNSEARRLIKQGAVSIDGEKILDDNLDLEIISGQILRVGRRRFAEIRLE